MILVLIAIVIGGLYLFSAVVTHVKVIRLSASEAILMSMVTSMFAMMFAFLVSGEALFAFIVFFVFLLFTVLLFWKRANRWWLMHEMEKVNSRSIQKERLDRGGGP